MKNNGGNVNGAVFFCQRIDPDQDTNRRLLEKELGSRIRFFPLPCSGRIDVLHLLRAIEAGADKVYVIACPEGSCRYGQGNIRARKRVAYARQLIAEGGYSPEALELVIAPETGPLSIDQLTRRLLGCAIPDDGVDSPAVFEKRIETVAVR